MKYVVPVEEDSNGDMIITFNDALLNQMGWDIGDKLLWEELPNGSWMITKEQDNE